MIRGKPLEAQVYEPEHIAPVMQEMRTGFVGYFRTFVEQPLTPVFNEAIEQYQKERPRYVDYLDLEALGEFEDNPSGFKPHTRSKCPIILRCLNSQDEVMKDYKISFGMTTGRQLLDTVRRIAEFGESYARSFDGARHESAATYADLGLGALDDPAYGCAGVIGYGVQSCMLYGAYPHAFAHRSQNASWALYFLSGRKDFGLRDGSEFIVADEKAGTCEQNYLYPAQLFGYYALQVYLMLKQACTGCGPRMEDRYRYIYLASFFNHIGEVHRSDIASLKWSSEHVESHWH